MNTDKDYRKSIKEQDQKWWLHQYCLYLGISLSKVKTKDKLTLDKSLTDELKYLKDLTKPNKQHNIRIQELEQIIEEHKFNIINSAPQHNWDNYDWDSHQVFENSKQVTEEYQIDEENKLNLIFYQHDIDSMKEYNIDSIIIKAHDIEEFRDDMKSWAVDSGLLKGLAVILDKIDIREPNIYYEDKDGRVLKFLRTICKGYSKDKEYITYFDARKNKEVSRPKLSYDIEGWISYCRLLDIGIDKYTTDTRWKHNKKEFIKNAFMDMSLDTTDCANIFRNFYYEYKSINNKSQARVDKLLELNLPNITDENIAKQIVKYSTLANVGELKKY